MPELPRRRLQPRQARSRQTVASILEAAREILQVDSPDALTTQAIADRAGVGIASLYRYFPNLDAIIVELCGAELLPHARHHEALLRGDPEALAPFVDMPLAERIRFVCERSVTVQRRLAGLLGPRFYERYFGAVSEAIGVASSSGVELMRLVLADRRHEIPGVDVEVAASLLQAWASAGIATLVSRADESLPDEVLVREASRMVLRYLGCPEAKTRGSLDIPATGS